MSSERWQRGRVLAIAGGVVATVAFVMLALRGIDPKQLRASWSTAHLWPWLPLSVCSYLIGFVIRGARCQLLFGPQAQLRLGTASTIVAVGYACNNILPLRLGEFVRAGMLSERTGAPFAKSFTIIVVERLLDGVAILALLVAVSWSLPVEGWVLQLTRTGAAVFGVAVLGLAIAVLMPSALVSLATRLTAVHPGLQSACVRLTARVTHAAQVLRDPRVLLKAAILSVLVWLFEAGLFAFLLPAFGVLNPFRTGILTMGVTNLGIMVPSTPGFVGPFHFFCQQALHSQGVGLEAGLSIAIAVHLAFYVPITLWGAAALLWYGVEVSGTLALARRARQAARTVTVGGVPLYMLEALPPRTVPPIPESRLLFSIVEALVAPGAMPAPTSPPSALTTLRLEPDPGLVRATAEFLEAELGALPSLLAIGLACGLTAFRGIVFITHLQTFCSLPLKVRVRIVRGWAWGPVGLARQMFRPLRSIALMAYFEQMHERVEAAQALDRPSSPATPIAAHAGGGDV